MINTGKCPKCEKTITYVTIEDVEVRVGFAPAWRGLSYICPHCKTVLSVAIDPVALKTDIVNAVRSAIKKPV